MTAHSNNTDSALKRYQRTHRENFPEGLALRTHRALSWLERAERCEDGDEGARFIFLWIAFNAAYAQDLTYPPQLRESELFNAFIKRICDLDSTETIYELVWDEYPKTIRVLPNNRYLYQPFWDINNGDATMRDWETRLLRHQRTAHRALAQQDTAPLLRIIFSMLYTLRNQLVHGGATRNGSVNREQVKQGGRMLGQLVPEIIARSSTSVGNRCVQSSPLHLAQSWAMNE